MEDQMCTQHEDERKKFYCVTCQKLVCRDCIVMKQHCRDHDYVTLKEAAEEKLSEMKQAMKQCDEKKKECQDMLQKIKNASTRCQALIESGSFYDIVENSKFVLETLQQVNPMTLNKVDVGLVKAPTSVSTGEFNQPWKQIGGFKVDCEYFPAGIAVTSDGKVAMCDYNRCVKVLSPSGDLLHTFDGPLGGWGDICITKDDEYIYPLESKSAMKHTSNYQVSSKFYPVYGNKQPSVAWEVTVDKNGLMIFGMRDYAISIHNPDGSLRHSFTIQYQPSSVAVTSNAEVVVASDSSVQLFNYSGHRLHTLDPPGEVTSWKPRYVCCSKTNEVFVLNKGNPQAIYKYIAGRVYVGCVTREVDYPYGIALSHDDQILYVTEASDKMVRKFQKP